MIMTPLCFFLQTKKEGKDQESMQSSTAPDPGYQWESDNVTIRHHKREPRGQKNKVSVRLIHSISFFFKDYEAT